MTGGYALANPLELELGKSRSEFTRKDLVRVIHAHHLERITFRYTDLDGRMHELKLPLRDQHHCERILANGERLDGSSIFKGVIDPGFSDLYVVPEYTSAFLNPFEDGSLDIMCRFITRDGEPAGFTPAHLLEASSRGFHDNTGLDLFAMGELEFYLFYEPHTPLYPNAIQAGYHASPPFMKTSTVLNEILAILTSILGPVKYAHGEVGFIPELTSADPQLNRKRGEQVEIEFLPTPVHNTGDILALAKWIIRNVAFKHEMLAVFSPKVEEGMAGNGLHIHLELQRDGQNVMRAVDGRLSDGALQLIGGLITYAPSLTAFGNTVAASYLRLVPHQEAPTRICWSESNRSALIRVPLGWSAGNDLAAAINPQQDVSFKQNDCVQTVELRSPDGSAIPHLLLAGVTTAARWGIENQERASDIAANHHITGNVFDDSALLERLPSLPISCADSANRLEQDRSLYEKAGVFPANMIDRVAELLRNEQDDHLFQELSALDGDERTHRVRDIMHRDINRR